MTHKDGRCQASERGNENNGRKFHWKLCNDEPPRNGFVQRQPQPPRPHRVLSHPLKAARGLRLGWRRLLGNIEHLVGIIFSTGDWGEGLTVFLV